MEPLYYLEDGVQLCQTYSKGSFNLTDYWMSEKFDGVRALYLGQQRLVTARGDPIRAPDWFFEQLPKDIPLDGELWLGHQRFNDISGLVRSRTVDPELWRNVKYLVFDMPVNKANPKYRELTFEQRQSILKTALAHHSVDGDTPGAVQLVEQQLVKDQEQFTLFYQQVIDAKGEGVVLIPPASVYSGGKRIGYKWKPIDDSEAVVIGYKEGSGKNTGLTGSLQVVGIDSQGNILPSQVYHIGTGLTDYQRANAQQLYPIGTVVVCHYNGVSARGIPRFPRLKGVRPDIVVKNLSDYMARV